jgi:hypothetical protein
MTDFLDRIVARVLPVQSREGVVRTRPRSRFEEGVAGVAELEEGGNGVESVEGASTWPESVQREGSVAEGRRLGGGEGEERPGGELSPARSGATSGPSPALRPARGGLMEGNAADAGEGSRPVAVPGAMSPEGSERSSRGWDARRGMEAATGGDGSLRGAAMGRGQEGAAPTPPLAGPGAPGRRESGGAGTEGTTGPDQVSPPAPTIRLRPSADQATPPVQPPSRPERRGAEEALQAPRGRDGLPLRPSAGADARFPLPPEPALPAIQLRIGRVEIRGDRAAPPAPRPPAPPPPRPRAPAVDLAEYLRRRDAGRRP